MRVTCKIDHSLPRSVEDVIQRRAALTLSRFGDLIEEVSVALDDVNGPRGGIDMSCSVRVKTRGLPPIIVREMAASAQSAIYGAFDRASRTVARRTRRRAEVSRMGRKRRSSKFLVPSNSESV